MNEAPQNTEHAAQGLLAGFWEAHGGQHRWEEAAWGQQNGGLAL